MSALDMSARISVREFARRAGCDEKQVRRAIERGLICKGTDGLISAGDVAGGWRKPNQKTLLKSTAEISKKVRTIENVRENETAAEAAERIVTQAGAMLPIGEAIALKENYLGMLRQLEYEQKSGALVAIADVAKLVGEDYASVRSKLLALPSSHAPHLHRLKSIPQIEDYLRSVITDALEDLAR